MKKICLQLVFILLFFTAYSQDGVMQFSKKINFQEAIGIIETKSSFKPQILGVGVTYRLRKTARLDKPTQGYRYDLVVIMENPFVKTLCSDLKVMFEFADRSTADAKVLENKGFLTSTFTVTMEEGSETFNKLIKIGLRHLVLEGDNRMVYSCVSEVYNKSFMDNLQALKERNFKR